MKIINKTFLFLSLILTSSAAFCAPYLSGEAGVVGYGRNNPFSNIFDNKESDKGASGRLSAGYLWNTVECLKLGVEAGISKNSNISTDDFPEVKYHRWGIDALGVADYNINEKFDVFAKAGAAYVNEKSSTNLGRVEHMDADFTISSETVVPKAVIGAGYNVAENVNLNLSLNHEFERNTTNLSKAAPGASALLVGVKYNFS